MNHELPVTKLVLWLVRLGTAPAVREQLRSNPMLFAHWYAHIGDIFTFPDEVVAIQQAQRAKKMTLDRTLTLLSKINVTLKDKSNVAYARSVLEGFDVHAWAVANPGQFLEAVKEKRTQLEVYAQYMDDGESGAVVKLAELTDALALTPVEVDLLTLAVACTASWAIQHLMALLITARGDRAAELWSDMFGHSVGDITAALGAKRILRASGLFQVERQAGTPRVDELWLKFLVSGSATLFDAVLEPLQAKHGAGMPARLTEEDMALGTTVLAKAKGLGVNLLLYGADGLEKRGVLRELVAAAGKWSFTLISSPEAVSEMPVVAFVAQRLLHLRFENNAVLVIDRPLDILERKPSDFMRQILGIDVDSAHIRPFDEMFLQDNPVATVWVGVAAAALPEETVSRFVFHAKLQKARKEERRAQMTQLLADLKLSAKTTEEILKLEDVSALQIHTARQAAELCAGTRRKDREAALVQAIKRSLAALQRNTTPKEKECVTTYSLDYLNCSGKFGPEKVMKALALRPKGSLCLYGPPGTGKTQFVEHLAATLGLPLVAKRASDLLSKYVGDNEKNIALMFAEAEAEEAILFLDEGDSFLRDRSAASQEWEITKVNELLQQMERFPGVFIVATNLFKGLDPAALRRFTFKLEFQALDTDQRLRMFLSETGLTAAGTPVSSEQLEAWNLDLALMPMLTAGDFATVKRQSLLLGETLSPADWVEQLRIECATKSRDTGAAVSR